MKPFKDFVNRFGKNNLIIISTVAAIIVVLLVLGALILGGSVGNPLSQKKPTTTVIPTAIPKPTTIPGDTIMITFRALPNSLTIKKGHLVNFANFSGTKVDIEGVDDKSLKLNIGILEDSGVSDMINLKESGTYKYFDKLNPKITGEIVVK